jgi:hypothetical protein
MTTTNPDENSQQQIETKDLYLYAGPISRQGYVELTNVITARADKSKTATLVLVTTGGDPDAGYRIGRAMGHYYNEGFDVMVPDICKSAGTLVCLAANELIISDRGELGPLDIQLSKPDEMFENGSGLDIMQSLMALRDLNLETFKESLVDVKVSAGISTKIASEIATKLASGIVAPIASQIDPIRWGEHQRAIYIAHSYGNRLASKFKNLKPYTLDKLVSNYPSHGFVIDRKEAAELFQRVRGPIGSEIALCLQLNQMIDNGLTFYRDHKILDLTQDTADNRDPQNEETDNESGARSEQPENDNSESGDNEPTEQSDDGQSGGDQSNSTRRSKRSA